MPATIDSSVVSHISRKEKEITHEQDPVANRPTAVTQKHIGEQLSGSVISEITQGEKHVTDGTRIKNGPTSAAQSILAKSNNAAGGVATSVDENVTSGPQTDLATTRTAEDHVNNDVGARVGFDTISKIMAAERKITSRDAPVKDGPTAQAQKHAGDAINSQTLHDITLGEKLVTGQAQAIKRGPTAILQSELAKCQLGERQRASSAVSDESTSNNNSSSATVE